MSTPASNPEPVAVAVAGQLGLGALALTTFVCFWATAAARHVAAGHGARVAFHREGEPGDTRTITSAELTQEVCRAAHALQAPGVHTGDRVAIFMPMIPDTAVAMPAFARSGAPYTVATSAPSPTPR